MTILSLGRIYLYHIPTLIHLLVSALWRIGGLIPMGLAIRVRAPSWDFWITLNHSDSVATS